TLARVVELGDERIFTPELDVRIDARAPDRDLAELFGWPVHASTRLTGSLEHVGAAALDGDPGTAWISAFGAATGATISIDGVATSIAEVTIQPADGPLSMITAVRLTVGDDAREAAIDGDTTVVLDPPLPAGRLDVEVVGIEPVTTTDRRFGDTVQLPVGVAEISFEGAPRADLDAAPVLECVTLARVADVPLGATIDLTGWRERTLVGEPLLAEPCTDDVTLGGEVELLAVDPGRPLQLDRVVLDAGAAATLAEPAPAVTADVVADGHFERTIEVAGCDDGCWLVFGEGFNGGWSARSAGVDLGAPVLIDGGFNGWWLDPGTELVTVRWGPQRTQDVAFALTLASVAVALALVVRDRRRSAPHVEPAVAPTWSWERLPSGQPGWLIVGLWTLPALLLAGPWWGLVALAGGLVAQRCRTVPIGALTTLAAVAVIGLAVTYLERRDAPFPGGGWPTTFESLHWVGMFAFATLAASALTDDR
ncbi:MAG: discoidin domain-containing protein, partial [Acidimicrobiia bacterium]